MKRIEGEGNLVACTLMALRYVVEKRGKGRVKKPSMTRTYSFLKLSVHSSGSKLINCFTVSSNVICRSTVVKTIIHNHSHHHCTNIVSNLGNKNMSS